VNRRYRGTERGIMPRQGNSALSERTWLRCARGHYAQNTVQSEERLIWPSPFKLQRNSIQMHNVAMGESKNHKGLSSLAAVPPTTDSLSSHRSRKNTSKTQSQRESRFTATVNQRILVTLQGFRRRLHRLRLAARRVVLLRLPESAAEEARCPIGPSGARTPGVVGRYRETRRLRRGP